MSGLPETKALRGASDHDRSRYEIVSPVTGEVVDSLTLAGKDEILGTIDQLSRAKEIPSEEVYSFLKRLAAQMDKQRDLFLDRTHLETGFIARDAQEIVDGAIEFLEDFEISMNGIPFSDRVIRHSYTATTDRYMRVLDRPVRCVAAAVPQNASLSLGIVIIASALLAGTRVILRPSLQCGGTGLLLAKAVLDSGPPSSCVAVVNSLANEFMDACCESESVDLIHYIGSNKYAPSVLNQAFSAGKMCLLDGQGNGWLYLDSTFPVDDAVRLITSGATRYNGETCTSVNGVLIDESIYESVKEAVVESFKRLVIGHPRQAGVDIGPLFSEKQATYLNAMIFESGNMHALCGGDVDGAFFRPAVVEGIQRNDLMVREGLFGPVIWINSVRENEVFDWLKSNRFPLSDTILSTNSELVRKFAKYSRAARICVNEDPSVESMFEPWGGYPPSGVNPVSVWVDKYRQTFQVDGRLREIMTLPRDVRIW
jgi:acyl-CoA reductase-like NAD-dependent aldehyde dehydrogenase